MDYWWGLDELVRMHELIIDRPKGSAHPSFPDAIYPVDYGYLKGTYSSDGDGVDMWRGDLESMRVQAVVVTVDLLKTDVEVKLIVGCGEEDVGAILGFHNKFSQRGILVERDG